MRHLIAYAAMTLSLFFELPIAGRVLDIGHASMPTAVSFHIISTALCAFAFYLLSEKSGRRLKRGNVWWIYALIASAVMPLYGIVSTIVIYSLQSSKTRKPPPIVSDEITVPDADVFAKPITRTRQIEVLERLDIEPFVDIFRRGQSELKKSAVKFLSSIQTQAAMKTLNRALMDEDIEVRLYAAGVIGLMDDNYAREIDTLRNKCSNNPRDVALALSLADLYIAYADSGLLDQIARTYYYRENIRFLSGFPESRDVDYRLALSHAALEEYEEAKRIIERCLAADRLNPDYNRLLCIILFSRREYAAVAEASATMCKEDIIPAGDELCRFWI